MPTSIGYRHFATALRAQPAAVSPQSGQHLIASPFGTIEPATYSYGVRPIGTAMPQPPAIVLANFDPSSHSANDWSVAPAFRGQPAQRDYPIVNRRMKGDRLPLVHNTPAAAKPADLPQLQPIDSAPAVSPASPSAPPVVPPKPRPTHAQSPVPVPAPAQRSDAMRAPSVQSTTPAPAPAANVGTAEIPAEIPPAGEIGSADRRESAVDPLTFADDDAQERSAQIYFEAGTIDSPSVLESWAPGATPIMTTASIGSENDVAAGKDESRLLSPALRLGLAGKARAKAEKCLADAVYFEARGEPLRGQEAVAQVVMNRVFSGYYPNNVCGVVYQNASHYLACQFTFACEHKDLSRIDEPDMWAQATRIAKDTLDGKIWLPDIGHATHYHAYWVHPSWVHEMTRVDKLGVHTFYRPRAWGNGDYEPVWGSPPTPSTSEQKPDAASSKGPEAEAAPAAGIASANL